MPPKYIKTDEPVSVQSMTTIVVPEEVKQELLNLRTDTRQCMKDIYDIRQDFWNYVSNTIHDSINISSIDNLEKRISALEKIVWRLEDYIEQWIDSDTMPPNHLRN